MEYTPDNLPTTLAYLRDIRDNLLRHTDWTQMPDSPLTDEMKTSWASYRSSLRSLPEHGSWPNLEDSHWPTKP